MLPWPGTGSVASGSGVDGVDWRYRAMFSPSTPDQRPTATIGSSCADLDCSFTATGFTDIDGSVDSYAWDFGDGETSTAATVEHTRSGAAIKSR